MNQELENQFKAELKTRFKAEFTDSERKLILDALTEMSHTDSLSQAESLKNDTVSTKHQPPQGVNWDSINKLPHNMEADKMVL